MDTVAVSVWKILDFSISEISSVCAATLSVLISVLIKYTNRPEPGESEAALRELFMELETIGGGVLVLDNVECCAGGRGRGDRLTSQLLTLLDTCR